MENKKDLTRLIAKIVSVYGVREEVVLELEAITSNMNRGAKIASIGEYASYVSKMTEIADHQVILNFDYANMLKEDKQRLAELNVRNIDVNKFNYDSIDLNGTDLIVFKNEVSSLISEAYNQLTNPTKKDRTNNDEWLNNVLVFNWNTERLSIVGQGVKKSVISEGEFVKTKSKPLTIAKKLIKREANLRADKYRRLCVENFSAIKLQGEVLEIY